MASLFKGNASNTALPLLHALMKTLSVKTALEFGAGIVSSPFFAKKTHRLVSIETNKKWLEKASKLCKGYGSREFIHQYHDPSDPGALLRHKFTCMTKINEHGPFDLIYVDQAVDLRTPTIETVIGLSNIIVFHDSEDAAYNYHQIKNSTFWGRYVRWSFRSFPVWTDALVVQKWADRFDKVSRAAAKFAECKVANGPYTHEMLIIE